MPVDVLLSVSDALDSEDFYKRVRSAMVIHASGYVYGGDDDPLARLVLSDVDGLVREFRLAVVTHPDVSAVLPDVPAEALQGAVADRWDALSARLLPTPSDDAPTAGVVQ